MKRVITAALLLTLSFTAAFISNYFLIKNTDKIAESLKITAEMAEGATTEELCEMSEKLNKEWEKCNWIIHAMTDADSVFEAERSIETLLLLAEAGLKDEFRLHCIDAYGIIKSINDSEKINRQNIF